MSELKKLAWVIAILVLVGGVTAMAAGNGASLSISQGGVNLYSGSGHRGTPSEGTTPPPPASVTVVKGVPVNFSLSATADGEFYVIKSVNVTGNLGSPVITINAERTSASGNWSKTYKKAKKVPVVGSVKVTLEDAKKDDVDEEVVVVTFSVELIVVDA